MSKAVGTDPMADLGDGSFALWGGNTDVNTTVRMTGPSAINDYANLLSHLGGVTNILTDVYDPEDVNMDGNVRATGPLTINDYAKMLSMLGVFTKIITEQL